MKKRNVDPNVVYKECIQLGYENPLLPQFEQVGKTSTTRPIWLECGIDILKKLPHFDQVGETLIKIAIWLECEIDMV